MSRRTREVFKKEIAPRIARKRTTKTVRLLVIIPRIAPHVTKETIRREVKSILNENWHCPVKVQSLAKDDRIVSYTPDGWQKEKRA